MCAAAGKRRGAVKRQVLQTDVQQELEPIANLLQHFARDAPPMCIQFAFKRLEEPPPQSAAVRKPQRWRDRRRGPLRSA